MPGRQPRVFLDRDVDVGAGKVGQPPGVIGVAMREDDVGHVLSPKAEPFDAPDGCQLLPELESGRIDGGLSDPLQWVSDVLQADAGIDDRQPAPLFKQQAVTGRLWIRWGVEKSAVQMMDRHWSEPFAVLEENH